MLTLRYALLAPAQVTSTPASTAAPLATSVAVGWIRTSSSSGGEKNPTAGDAGPRIASAVPTTSAAAVTAKARTFIETPPSVRYRTVRPRAVPPAAEEWAS